MNNSLLLRNVVVCKSFFRNMKFLNQKAFVNGKWTSAASNKTFEVKNPVDGSVVGCVPDMGVEDVESAIDSAHRAFQTWQDTTAKERSILLRKLYDNISANSEDLAKLISCESGKSLTEARGEVTYGASFIDWFSEEARRIRGEIIASPAKSRQIMVTKEPIGPVAFITPWNFPLAMILRKAGAALAAGCTCISRPAEDTPFTALAIAQLMNEVGFPEGTFNVVTSDRGNAPVIGKVLCESSKIAGLSFTGSSDVGKILYALCSKSIKRISLELGGNAPFIVFESADIDQAVQGAMISKFRNCGQACVASNRFLIHECVFDEFISKFKVEVSKLKIGENIGPLINQAQLNKVDMFVRDSLEKGATAVCGCKPAKKHGPLFYEPSIIIGLKKDMLSYEDEIFGPIASCMKFSTEEEAVKIANDTPRGLAGYFYSNDLKQIMRVSRKLEVGMVGINEGLISTPEAPFGGVKESGIGREGSHHGIDDFVNIKYLCFGNL